MADEEFSAMATEQRPGDAARMAWQPRPQKTLKTLWELSQGGVSYAVAALVK